MARSFVEFVRAMKWDADRTVQELRTYAGETSERSKIRHSVIDLLHSESLRVEMLQTLLKELGPSSTAGPHRTAPVKLRTRSSFTRACWRATARPVPSASPPATWISVFWLMVTLGLSAVRKRAASRSRRASNP